MRASDYASQQRLQVPVASQGPHAEMGHAMTWVRTLPLRTEADPDMSACLAPAASNPGVVGVSRQMTCVESVTLLCSLGQHYNYDDCCSLEIPIARFLVFDWYRPAILPVPSPTVRIR